MIMKGETTSPGVRRPTPPDAARPDAVQIEAVQTEAVQTEASAPI
jgi:hypothetical protein